MLESCSKVARELPDQVHTVSVHKRGFSFKEEMRMNSFVLPGLAEKCVWEKFALLLTRCWSSLDNRPGREAAAKHDWISVGTRSLLAAMLVLPELLRAAPGLR